MSYDSFELLLLKVYVLTGIYFVIGFSFELCRTLWRRLQAHREAKRWLQFARERAVSSRRRS